MRFIFNILCLVNTKIPYQSYRQSLERNHILCHVVHTIQDAYKALKMLDIQMVVLIDDSILTVIEYIRKIRVATWSPISVMFEKPVTLTTKIHILEAGAIDIEEYNDSEDCVQYMIALLRSFMNLYQHTVIPQSIHIHGHLLLSPSMRTVYVADQPIYLNRKQFDILYLLMREPGRVFTFSQILRLVWGEEYEDAPKTLLYVQMQQLRKKIQINPDLPQFIKTVIGVGYSFDSK